MAAAQPHHRSAEFATITNQALAGARWLWDTEDDVLFLSGSGTVGMEAAMRSCLAPGDRVLAVSGGKFAERWIDIARLIGCDVTLVDLPWGEGATPALVAQTAAGQAPFDAMVCVASETSSGVLHPVADLAAAFRGHSPDGLVLVDGITAVGCADLSMKRDGFDVLTSGSQKSFGLPPGLAMVGVSARAWARIAQVDNKGYYLDLRKERKQTATGQSAFTPAIALIVGFNEVIARWQTLGREALFAHATTLSQGTLAGIEAMGLLRFPAGQPSPALTAVEVPSSIDIGALRKRLREHYGCHIAGGQNHLKDRIIRIGHLGAVDAFDIVATLSALELALSEQGHSGTIGAGPAAALQAMAPGLQSAPSPQSINP